MTHQQLFTLQARLLKIGFLPLVKYILKEKGHCWDQWKILLWQYLRYKARNLEACIIIATLSWMWTLLHHRLRRASIFCDALTCVSRSFAAMRFTIMSSSIQKILIVWLLTNAMWCIIQGLSERMAKVIYLLKSQFSHKSSFLGCFRSRISDKFIRVSGWLEAAYQGLKAHLRCKLFFGKKNMFICVFWTWNSQEN